MLDTAGPAEVEARLRLALGRLALLAEDDGPATRSAPATSSSTRRPTPHACPSGALDLTFKEFELLKFLAQHPGRVFTRAQLLQEVWGYDYFGGTRTVDVHVRRLRAKLGAEHDALIGTVRNVGYRFVLPPARRRERRAAPPSDDRDARRHRPALEVARASSSPTEVDAVALLVEAVTEADGVRPLSEHAMLHLRHGGDTGVRHLLLWPRAARLAGYLHLDVTDAVDGSSAELAVHPGRCAGAGSAARWSRRARRTSRPDGRLRLWAHGEQSGARALAESLGFTRMRTLWQMRRSLYSARCPRRRCPTVCAIRTFVPGQDDEAWVALNAAAFADHAEQGAWTVEDLQRPDRRAVVRRRRASSSPCAGEGSGRSGIVGFHWTKVHGGVSVHRTTTAAHVHDDGHGTSRSARSTCSASTRPSTATAWARR